MSKKKSNKKSKNRITHTGIIHGQNSIYINKVKSYDGNEKEKVKKNVGTKLDVFTMIKLKSCVNGLCLNV